MITVRLFAALRELAGASRVDAAGRTVGEVVDDVSERYGERFASIAAVSSVVVNGERATRDGVVAEGDEVAILPPVSGGARAPTKGAPRTAATELARLEAPERAPSGPVILPEPACVSTECSSSSIRSRGRIRSRPSR